MTALPIPPRPADLEAGEWTEAALRVLRERYLLKDARGAVIETPEDLCWRVAWTVAQAERAWGAVEPAVEALAREFYGLMVRREVLPNSPTLMNAGKGRGLTFAACFVLPLGDSIPEIFGTLGTAALTHKAGGGTGLAFSRLRPKNSRVRSSGGTSSGPVSFLRIFDTATEHVKQGGCLAPTTYIHTDRGLLTLGECVDPAGPPWQPHALQVFTDSGWARSDEGHAHGLSPTLTVTLSNGVTLTGTPEHRAKVWDGTEETWRRFDELKAGDLVKIALGGHQGAPQPLAQPTSPRHPNEDDRVRLPATLDESLARWLGYYYGNGFFAHDGSSRVGATLPDARPDLQRWFVDASTALFGKAPTPQHTPNDGSTTFVLSSKLLYEWLTSHGFAKPRAPFSDVPRRIRQSEPSVVAGFIRGYFDADGSLGAEGYPEATSTSRRFLEGLQTLLFGLGIPSQLTTPRNPADSSSTRYGYAPIGTLRIRPSESLRRFNALIRWPRALKTGRKNGDPANERLWPIPGVEPLWAQALDHVRNTYGYGVYRAFSRAISHFLPGSRALRTLTYGALRRIIRHFAPILKDTALAATWAHCQATFWTTVKAVHPGPPGPTVDLSIPGPHSYVANGVVTHNTRRGANMAVLRCDHPDLLEFIDSKRDGSIANFNISVAITDAFMAALDQDTEYPLRAQPGGPRPDGSDYQGSEPYLDPETGQPMTLRAREVWDRICRAAWATGDPGLFFLDRTNRWPASPVPARYAVESPNPCVPGDTLVATPAGWVPAEKLAPGDWLLTPAGARRLARIERSVHPVSRVRFSDGGAVRATAGHQFFARPVAEPGTGTRPIRLDQLGRGDLVRVVRQGHPTLRDWAGEAKILGIAPDGVAEVVDLYEPTTDSWLPEGYLSRGCGEQPLYPDDQCTLGSVNLGAFVHADPAARSFDWDRLGAAVGLATRFLDDVLEASPPPTAAIGQMVRAIRRIGLGVMGWADALIRLGLPYDSEEAVELAGQVMRFITDTAERASIALARARGPFPLWPESIYRDGPPRRNSTVTTIAPTGCLTADTLIASSRGLAPLGALGNPQAPTWQPLALQVATDQTARAATQFFVNGRHPCLTIRTRLGFTLTGTLSHRIRGLDPDGTYRWFRLDELTSGTPVALAPGRHLPPAPTPLIPLPTPQHWNSTPLTTPATLTEDLALILGWYMGNGYLKRRGGLHIVVSNRSPELGKTVQRAIERTFALSSSIEARQGCGIINACSADLVRWFTLNGFAKPKGNRGEGAAGAFIPAAILSSPAAVIAAFLRGLFDTDGSVGFIGPRRSARVSLSTVSGWLGHQVQQTLLALGIISRIRRLPERTPRFGRRPRYEVSILNHANAQRFAETVGFTDEHKHTRLLSTLARPLARGNQDSWRYDNLFGAQLLHTLRAHVRRHLGHAHPLYHVVNHAVQAGRISRGAVNHILAHTPPPPIDVTLLSLFFDPVAEITPTMANTFDLSVPDGHTYLANGFVSHNTIALLAGCSSGIEPLYAVAFTHTVRRPEGDRVLPIVTPLFETLARGRGIVSEALMAEVARRGTVRGLDGVPEDLQRLFGTAHEIGLEWHVRHQAAFQQHTHNGVSKTINLPHSATVADVDRAYRLAWESGCLGITVFRDGCKGEQILTVGTAAAAAMPAITTPTPTPDAPLVRPRPARLDGPTFKVETPLGTAYVTVTLQDGEPLEVFVNIGKSGTDTGAFAEALGRLVSTLLRLQRLPSRPDRAREVIDQLRQIGGSHDIGLGPHRIRSVPDAVAWALQQALEPPADPRQLSLPEPPAPADGPTPARLGDLCPECGAAAVVYEEGCRHCLACGLYSEC